MSRDSLDQHQNNAFDHAVPEYASVYGIHSPFYDRREYELRNNFKTLYIHLHLIEIYQRPTSARVRQRVSAWSWSGSL